MSETHIPETYKRLAVSGLQALFDNVSGIMAAVVSTADGFDIASIVHNVAQVDRLAAMASSISALGHVVGQESGLGAGRFVLIEAKEGFLVVIPAHSDEMPLTLSVIAGREAVVGQVVHYAKQTARQLAEMWSRTKS
jgi:uncharacterized protein